MNAETVAYGIDIAAGTALIWLGLHYAARLPLTIGIAIIVLAIAAQNARFAVDLWDKWRSWRKRKT